MSINTKTNLMVPNKLTAFNRVKLIAMADAGVRHSAIARDLGITQQAVIYHVDRQKELTAKYTVSTDDVPTMISTMTSQPPKGDTLVTKGYLVGSTYYGTFDEVVAVVTLGDTVETVTVTSTQVVGLVETKEG